MNIPANRRLHPRRAAFIIAEYTIKEGTFRDVIKNISADGLFVTTWRSVVADQPILLRFPLFQLDHTIQVSGKVVRTERDGFAVAFDDPITGLTCKEGMLPEIVHQAQVLG